MHTSHRPSLMAPSRHRVVPASRLPAPGSRPLSLPAGPGTVPPPVDRPGLSFNRRRFLRWTGAAGLGVLCPPVPLLRGANSDDSWDPDRPLLQSGRPLVVQPVLMYRLPVPKELSSWKSWGGVQTPAAVAEEVQRITTELKAIAAANEGLFEFRSVAEVSTPEQAAAVHRQTYDVSLIYACTGGGDLLRACADPARDTLLFVRHRSGPVYYWYEALSVKYLDTRDSGAAADPSPSDFVAHADDVVVDDPGELTWRLRALGAVRNTRGARVLALGGAWGKYSPDAPQQARERFGFEIAEVGYDDLAARLERARSNPTLLAAAERGADRYLELPGTTLKTDRPFVVNAFILYRLFKDQMAEHNATAFTVKSCMGTIIPMSRTTACLTLSLLNDEGHAAFCESDFVVVPAGLLLRQLTRQPVFLHNSTFPHQGIATCAHCTAPRRMDGRRYEPAQILTHYESEYGAAPKVEIPLGQRVSFVNPEYTRGRWVGFQGVIQDNPFYDICRSQQDVTLLGRWQELRREVRDSHWLMVYGDWLPATGYAARKFGLTWVDLSAT